MTRKDFELIASTINNHRHGSNEKEMNGIARSFAVKLADTNPNFDRERFLKACGVEA